MCGFENPLSSLGMALIPNCNGLGSPNSISMNRGVGTYSRRQILVSGATGGLLATAGCLGSFGGGSDPETDQLSLNIKALPSDEDPVAAEIARELSETLTEVGVDASFSPRASPLLADDVFYEQDFDIFIDRSPRVNEPTALLPMLHSAYDELPGDWLNPFGFSNAEVDAFIEAAYHDPDSSSEQLHALQEALATEHVPLSVVGLADELTAVASTLVGDTRPAGLETADDLLSLGQEPASDPIDHLTLGVLNGEVLGDLNPLAGHHPIKTTLVDLIYDPLIRTFNGVTIPWSAVEVSWDEGSTGPTADVALHEDLTWHDGTDLDADDVAFTYRFFGDLADGTTDTPIPAGQYVGKTIPIDSIEVVSDTLLHFVFDDIAQSVAQRALTVPLLPEHIWTDRIGLDDGIPAVLQEPELEPVGSGPYTVSEIEPNETLDLQRYPNHLSFDGSGTLPSPALESLTFVVPSRPPTVKGAVNMIADGELDILANVPNDTPTPPVETDGVDLVSRESSHYYLVGFNTRRAPCSDPALRRLIGRLVDRTYVAATVFRGFGRPAESPLAGTKYEADSLEWSGESVLGAFPGSGGFVEAETARDLFEEIGFEYDSQREAIVVETE